MNIKRPSIGVLTLCALTFAPITYAANAFFPPGTSSAAVWGPQPISAEDPNPNISEANILSSNADGCWLVFDDYASYTTGGITLRNRSWTGEDSGIYIQSGTLNVLSDVTLGGTDSTRGFLDMTGGTLNVSANMNISGRAASGSFTAANATVEVLGSLLINTAGATETAQGTSNGYLTLDGTTTMYVAGATNIGNANTSSYGSAIATMTVKGQASFRTNIGSSFLTIGRLGGSEAFFNVEEEGSASSGRTIIGDTDGSRGTLTVTGSGSFTATNYTILGNRTGASGTVSLLGYGTYDGNNAQIGGTSHNTDVSYGYFSVAENSQATFSGDTYVGHGIKATGTLSVADSASYYTANISIADAAGASGTVSVTGGTLSTGNFLIGRAAGGSGTVSITGGTVSISGTLNLSTMVTNASTSAQWDQSGGSVRAMEIYVGSNNTDSVTTKAVLNLTGGSLISDTFFNVGASRNNGTASAQAHVSGTGKLTAQTISVMRDGTISATNINVGAGLTPGDGEIAANFFYTSAGSTVSTGRINTADGALTVRGGSLSATEMNIGVLAGGVSNVAISGGTVSISSEISLANKAASAGATATYTQSGGTVWAKQASLGGASASGLTTSATMHITGGKLTIGNFLTMSTNSAAGATSTLITVGPNGTLEAGRINVNGGATLDVAGTLLMIAPVSGTNNVTLNAAGSNDTANMIVREAATVSILGNLNLNANSRLALEVGNAFNTIMIGGTVNFGIGAGVLGTQKLTLDFSDYTGAGGEIELFSTSMAITGFDQWYATAGENLILLGLNGRYVFEGLALGADSMSLIARLAIPEPAVASLLCGLLALAAAARRKRG